MARFPLKVDWRFSTLLLCFVFSGAAGLIYQTAWTQQFAFVFGTSELALITVLSAYMAGLALGAAVAARCQHRIQRPVRVYALLELGIGLTALAVPAAIDVAGQIHVTLTGGSNTLSEASSGATLYYLISSLAILLVPTALMGATLPLLVRHAVRREADIGPRVGILYSGNTAGAAAGTLGAAFVLLPGVGLGWTLVVAATINLLVFSLAFLLVRGDEIRSVVPSTPRPTATRRFHWILPAMLVSGGVSFTHEVLWTRLLSHLVGGSVYSFATMLATFLTGITVGGLVAARLATSSQRARHGFAASQATVALTSLAAFHVVNRLPALALALAPGGAESLAVNVALSAAVLLPTAVAIGATFPFAVRILAQDASGAAAASARVFAWNTTGAISGALLAGYLVLPALRFAGTARVAAIVSLLLAAATLAVRPRLPKPAAAVLASLLLVVFMRPPTPWAVLRHSPLGGGLHGEPVFYAVGRSATVLLLEQPATWRLTTNGLPESGIERTGVRTGRQATARWLSLLPVALRSDIRSLLVVGLGAGVTVEDVPETIRSIDVVELEPEVVRANRVMASQRRKDPLADPRIQIHLGDARGALRLTQQRFDAIVSQPSHPWTAGASHLFTREFLSLVRQRLNHRGVFVQWMGLPFVDGILLRSLVATALDVFPYVEVYEPVSGAVLIVASGHPLTLTVTADKSLLTARRQWTRLGIFCREDLLAARVLSVAGARSFSAGAPVSTDWRNLMRTGSPRILRHALGARGADRLFAPFEPLLTALDEETIDHLYLVRRLIRNRKIPRARRIGEALPDLVERATAVGLVEMSLGRGQRAAREFNKALDLDSSFDEALFALLSLNQPTAARGRPMASLPPRVQETLLFRLRKGPAAAVLEGWRLEATNDWRGVELLEAQLADIEPRHPFFVAATRLRVGWRVASGETSQAHEALDLADMLLSAPTPLDLLWRARAGAATGNSKIALDTIADVVSQLRGRTDLVATARGILAELPSGEFSDWRRRIQTQLDELAP